MSVNLRLALVVICLPFAALAFAFKSSIGPKVFALRGVQGKLKLPVRTSSSKNPCLFSTKTTLNLPPIASIEGEVTLPGSKSLSNRILLLSSLSEGKTAVKNLLDSDDVNYMLSALNVLGVDVDRLSSNECVVEGVGGPLPVPKSGRSEGGPLTLDLGNAGTAMRPMCASLSFSDLPESGLVLDGVQRMRERPIKDLIDGLDQLGVEAELTGLGDEGELL